MNARNLLPPSIGLLGLLGILGMLASMLACRPSWSPDGSKILFPYYDPETHDVGVALYDRATGKARSLFARQSARWDDRVVIGQWERGGERAVLFSGERELLTLPVDSPRPAPPDRGSQRSSVRGGTMAGGKRPSLLLWRAGLSDRPAGRNRHLPWLRRRRQNDAPRRWSNDPLLEVHG